MDAAREITWLLNEKYSGVATPRFFADLKRLETGEPLAYVIGWVEFLGCRIDLSERPLIPRPETEFWTESIIRKLKNKKRQLRILDLFSGSGCIGTALAKHLPNAWVDFGEKDPHALRQIRKNLAMNRIPPSRVRILPTNVFSRVTGTYDIVVANPPYIDPMKANTVQRSVRSYEPRGALFAKEHGLFFIKRLLAEGAQHLAKDGSMYIEFGHGQKRKIEKLARTYGWSATFAKDQFGKWRVAELTYKFGP